MSSFMDLYCSINTAITRALACIEPDNLYTKLHDGKCPDDLTDYTQWPSFDHETDSSSNNTLSSFGDEVPTLSAAFINTSAIYTTPLKTTFTWTYSGPSTQTLTIQAASARVDIQSSSNLTWKTISSTINPVLNSIDLDMNKFPINITNKYYFRIGFTVQTTPGITEIVYFKTSAQETALASQYTLIPITTCAQLNCDVSKQLQCTEWKSEGESIKDAFCSCIDLIDDEWSSPLGPCIRTKKCDAEPQCGGEHGFLPYSSISGCSSVCTCSPGYKSANNCSACAATCTLPLGISGSTTQCGCDSCLPGYTLAAAACSQCTRYSAITVTDPVPEIASIINAIDTTPQGILLNEFKASMNAILSFVATASHWDPAFVTIDYSRSKYTSSTTSSSTLIIVFIFSGECNTSSTINLQHLKQSQFQFSTAVSNIVPVQTIVTSWNEVTQSIDTLKTIEDVYLVSFTSNFISSVVVDPTCIPADAQCPQDTFYGSIAFPCYLYPSYPPCRGGGGDQSKESDYLNNSILIMRIVVGTIAVLVVGLIVAILISRFCCNSKKNSDSIDVASVDTGNANYIQLEEAHEGYIH